MSNLSINMVLAEAPAAAKRKDADREGLIDTTAFLRFVKRQGFSPVLAVQGSGHDDSAHAKEKNGRHLVISARPSDGRAVFLLNSHTKDRRAHIGLGWWDNDGFLIGPSTPVQRWLGYEDTLDDLHARAGDMQRLMRKLQEWCPNTPDISHISRAMSRHGYMEGVMNRPDPRALVEDFVMDGDAKELGFTIIRRMRKGNIEARDGGRCIKAVRRPDGLFHAGMVCLHEIILRAQAEGVLGRDEGFEPPGERLVRP